MAKSKTFGKGMPAPDPEGTWDEKLIEGPDSAAILDLLEESTKIAEADFAARQLIASGHRAQVWKKLREYGVTVKRIVRSYAVDQGDGVGVPIITHVGVINATEKAGFVPPNKQAPEAEEEA